MASILGKLRIGLQAGNGLRLKGLGGEALHGLFFRLLRQTSPELASEIHRQEDQRPFSLTPPLTDCELRGGYVIASPGTTLSFDLAFLSEELFAVCVSAFLSILQDGRTVILSRQPVVVQSVDLREGAFSSFERIISEASLSSRIVMQFVTPTSFRKNEMQVTFPQPELVFSSLLRRWNAFSQFELPVEHLSDFASIKVSSYDLHTELVEFSKYKIIGFKGKVEYELPRDGSTVFVRTVNALAQFAIYSGVGAKTAMGMGQVQRGT